MLLNLIVIASVVVILLFVIFNDLRRMRIPNILTILLLALFPLQALSMPDWPAVLYQIGFAALVFALGFAAFAIRAMGGGDVKILAGLALYIPLSYLAEIFVVFAVCIFLAVGFVLVSRKFKNTAQSDWTYLTEKKFPLGLPIGLSGLIIASISLLRLV